MSTQPMISKDTSSIYLSVIENVINNVRDDFIKEGGPNETSGPGEGVLRQLQGMWELKMMNADMLIDPKDRPQVEKQPAPGAGINTVHDLNVPYEELETPTAAMFFPNSPLETPLPTPLPGTADNSMYNIPTGPSEYSTPGNDVGAYSEAKGGRPSPYMQTPSPWSNQRTPLSVDVNVAYVEGREEVDRGAPHQSLTQDFLPVPSGKRKRDDLATQFHNGGYIPQQDGAGDFVFELSGSGNAFGKDDNVITASRKIPQLDGPIPDPYEDILSPPNTYTYQGVVNEDYNIANTPAPVTPAPVIPNDVDDDDDDEPLNEDDDEDLDDLEHEDEQNDPNGQHLVLAQFDKVSRTKSRWKCNLKDGIVHINGRDILFNKATGEFEF